MPEWPGNFPRNAFKQALVKLSAPDRAVERTLQSDRGGDHCRRGF